MPGLDMNIIVHGTVGRMMQADYAKANSFKGFDQSKSRNQKTMEHWFFESSQVSTMDVKHSGDTQKGR